MVEAKKSGRGRPKGSKNKPKDAAAAGSTTEHDRPSVEDLTDDEEQVLFYQHKRKYDAALEKKKAAAADFLVICKAAKADLGPTVIDQIKLAHALDSDEGKRFLKERIGWQAKIARWKGMPVGHIDDLFPDDDRTPLEDKTFADGRRAGLAGESCAAPHHLNGALIQKWTAGWHEGQAANLAGIKQKPEGETFGAKGDPEAPPETVKDAAYWEDQGGKARRNGVGGAIPDTVPAAMRDAWHNGWIKVADEIDLANAARNGARPQSAAAH